MTSDWPLLVQVLRRDRSLADLRLVEWDLLIRQARRSLLLGKLCYMAEAAGIYQALPEQAKRHLLSARIQADKQVRDLQWEVKHLIKAFAGSGCPLLFLKGAAYAVAQLPSSPGRLFSDIDLMVPISMIGLIEKCLLIHGWIADSQDEYDQQYYRRWMHEIPPLRQVKRDSVIDLHHNILPRTAAACPDAQLLLDAAVPVENDSPLWVLSPLDRIIHSATHLFYDGELEHGLRDLTDLQALLAELSSAERLALVARARQLGLLRPVYYALRYVQIILNQPGLDEAQNKIRTEGFSAANMVMMDALFVRALLPAHASCADRWTASARLLLYIRAHWLRMPWYLLIPHLSRKAWLLLVGDKKT